MPLFECPQCGSKYRILLPFCEWMLDSLPEPLFDIADDEEIYSAKCLKCCESDATPAQLICYQKYVARNTRDNFGAEKAMGYLIGGQFLKFLEKAEADDEWRRAIPDFVAAIIALFEASELADFLNTPRRLGALGQVVSEDAHRKFCNQPDEQRLQEDARNVRLWEWAKELLLEV